MGGPPRRRPVAVLVVCGRQERPAAIPGRCEGRTASDLSDRRRCGYEQRNECGTGSAERRRERQASPRSDPFLVAAFGSFLLSIGLWFADNHDEGVFVGLWVPSILSAGVFWMAAVRGR